MHTSGLATSTPAHLTYDLITDIQGVGAAGGDVVDVSGIDADTVAAGNQTFAFIGLRTFVAGDCTL